MEQMSLSTMEANGIISKNRAKSGVSALPLLAVWFLDVMILCKGVSSFQVGRLSQMRSRPSRGPAHVRVSAVAVCNDRGERHLPL